MARKVATQNQQRRSTINRAHLKAQAARQAMANTSTNDAGKPSATPALDLSGIAVNRRRFTLTREQEFSYIRTDLIRLTLVSLVLLIVMIVALVILR